MYVGGIEMVSKFPINFYGKCAKFKWFQLLKYYQLFQTCICCHKEKQELYTAARYACHRTHPADRDKHNKLCKTCATDMDHPDDNSVTNDCIDHCRIHGEHAGREDAS